MNNQDQEREAFALVSVERSYDMRAAAIMHFNTARGAGADLDDALDAAWRATLSKSHQPDAAYPQQTASVAVPDGWKLVPVEPTSEMVKAFKERVAVTNRGGLLNTGHALAAAINAAPAPEVQQAPDVSGLVEALEQIAGADWQSSETATDFAISQTKGFLIAKIKRAAKAALAAHRAKQETEQAKSGDNHDQ